MPSPTLPRPFEGFEDPELPAAPPRPVPPAQIPRDPASPPRELVPGWARAIARVTGGIAPVYPSYFDALGLLQLKGARFADAAREFRAALRIDATDELARAGLLLTIPKEQVRGDPDLAGIGRRGSSELWGDLTSLAQRCELRSTPYFNSLEVTPEQLQRRTSSPQIRLRIRLAQVQLSPYDESSTRALRRNLVSPRSSVRAISPLARRLAILEAWGAGGDPNQAMKIGETAVSLHPGSIRAWTYLGIAAWKAGNLEGVETAFNRVFELARGSASGQGPWALGSIDGSLSRPRGPTGGAAAELRRMIRAFIDGEEMRTGPQLDLPGREQSLERAARLLQLEAYLAGECPFHPRLRTSVFERTTGRRGREQRRRVVVSHPIRTDSGVRYIQHA